MGLKKVWLFFCPNHEMFLSDFWNHNPLLHNNFVKLQQEPFVAGAAKFAFNVLAGYR